MRRVVVAAMALLLASCGNGAGGRQTDALKAFDVAEPRAAKEAGGGDARATAPQIAYTHSVTYDFDRPGVAGVQGQQLALCRTMGPAHCVVVKSTLNTPGRDDHVVTDEAVLLVDARQVAAVNARLDALATGGGGRVASRQVEAEDVTRQVIDTDARVRAKQALADRLMTIIRSGNGNVGELVQAERAYATTQEELDAARGERAALAQRVAMSRITITYAFNDTPGRDSPVGASIANAGTTLMGSIATLITFLIVALPWLIVGGVAIAVVRRVRRKRGWRWPRRAVAPAAESPPSVS